MLGMQPKYGCAALCAGFAVGACGEAPNGPPMIFTEHTEITLFGYEQICRGRLDNIDAQIERVAELLDLAVPDPLIVAFGESEVEAVCGDTFLGCVLGADEATRVMSDSFALNHELVHGVRWYNGVRGLRFFEEGIAVLLSIPAGGGYGGSTSTGSPAQLARGDYDDFGSTEYAIAGSFMGWLWIEYGHETVAEFLNDPGARKPETVDATFTAHFGLDLDAAEVEYRANEKVESTGPLCQPDRRLTWEDGVTWSARLGCDEPGVPGTIPGIMVVRGACFHTPAAGEYRFEVEGAPEAKVELRNLSCEGAGLSAEHFQSKFVNGGESKVLPFAQCEYEVLITVPGEITTDVTMRVTAM